MNNNKEHYRQFSKTETSIPVFSRDWWLDAVCGEKNWDVALVNNGKQVIGTMPYYIKKRMGFTLLTQPPLTQTLGPWIRPSTAQYAKVLSYQNEVMSALIEQLPKYDYFSQNWHYSNTNWQPFHWKGFKQTTSYTYVIESLKNVEDVISRFSHAKRKNIKKASNLVRVFFDLDANDFYENHKMTTNKQGAKLHYSRKLFERMYNAGYENNAARTIYAIDAVGNIHAALFVIWDENSAYDLISTIDPDYRNSGAASLLIADMIRFVSTRTRKFDFEGSMTEPVAASFRQFNARQKLIFNINKTNSKLLQLRESLFNIIGR